MNSRTSRHQWVGHFARQVVIASLALTVTGGLAYANDTRPRQEGRAAIAAAASEGPRDLKSLAGPLKAFIESQPYGKQWRQIVPTAPPPRDRSGTGKARTVPELQHDRIEMQEQAEFKSNTDFAVRYGLVSIRGQHVFRFGTLVGVRLVLERIGQGRAQDQKYRSDIAALAKVWAQPAKALGVDRTMLVAVDELQKRRRGPLVIELQPRLIKRR